MNFIFKNPKSTKIIYLRNKTSKELPLFLKNKKILNLYTLETLQSLYFFILLRAILISLFQNIKIKNFKTRLKINYYKLIFQITGPKVIISTNENDPLFYFLKFSYEECKYLIIQNGRKNHNYLIDILNDFAKENNLQNPYVDYFFCFGKNFADSLGSLLLKKTKFITHGSLTNNEIKIISKKKKNYVCIISELTNLGDKKFLSEIFNRKFINFDDYYNAEKFILPKIFNFFHNKNTKIMIITRCNYDDNLKIKNNEKNFFNSLNKKNFKSLYFSCDRNLSLKQKYQLTDNSILNFGFGVSSMDFEVMVRGNKFCFFNYRGMFLKKKYGDCAFWYWPLKNQHFFYTLSEFEEKKINLHLSKLIKKKEKNYYKHKNFLENFILYNYKNTKLKKLLKVLVK